MLCTVVIHTHDFPDITTKWSMRSILLLAEVVVFSAGSLLGQRSAIPEDTLAEIGSTVITAREFLERFELMPFPGKEQSARHDSARIWALRGLVAEKLLSQEAAVQGLNRDSASLRRRSGLERLMARDELFKREVAARVTVSDRELSAGMRRYPRELQIIFFAARSAAAARELRDSLASSPPLAASWHRFEPRLLLRADTVTVKFGSQDWTLEDTAYALTKKRRLSQPVKTDYFGWGVLYLLEERANKDAANKSVSDRISAVRSMVRQRKMDARAARYQATILSPQRAEVDSVLFEQIGDVLLFRIAADAPARASRAGYRMIPSDIDSLVTMFGTRADEELVHLPGQGMTIRDALDALQINELAFPVLNREPFLNRLNAALKDVVRKELLAREAYRQNIHQTDAVRHDVGVWDNYWSAGALIQSIRDSIAVDDQEVMTFLIHHGAALGAGYEVNVREVLCDSLNTALDVLQRALQGETLGTMARELSRRPGWPSKEGESGFFAVDVYPSLGFPALFQESGTIGGPVHLKEGFSVFTTLGKRSSRPDGEMHLDSVKYWGTRGARLLKQERAVESLVSTLARREGVRLHLDRLSQLKVTPSNMFTRRYLGFGGVVTAVPTILPVWKWKGEEREGIVP